MADFDAQFLFDYGPVHGFVDSIPQQVFFDVSAPRTAPIITITPSNGSSITRTASIQVDVTDDLAALSDITIWAVLADGTTETIWNGAAFTAKFSGGSTSSLALGTRFTFAYSGFGWPTTAVTIWAKAVDPVGAAATPVSAAYTISNPPAAPTIGSFVPATAGSQARAASMQLDITDAEGASALVMILITAITADGTRRRVATGSTIHAPFTAGTSRSSIANGYRYVVAWDTPGWPSSTASVLVEAMNNHGLLASVTWTATISDPPAPPDVTQPTVTIISPTPPGPIGRNDPVKLQVTDVGGLRRVKLYVTMGDEQYVVHNGYGFRTKYATGSTITTIANGFEYVLLRSGGWLAAPSFEVYAIDTAGNER